MEGQFWSIAIVLGPIILLLVLAYAVLRRRRLPPADKQAQSEALKDIYRGGEGGPNAPPSAKPPKPDKDG